MTTPTTQDLLDAVKALVEEACPQATVLDYWPAALVRSGQSLNFGRDENGKANVWCFSLYEQEHARLGDVPERAERVEGRPYTRQCEWTFRVKFIRAHFDGEDEAGRRSERLFDEDIQRVVDALGLSPKLGGDRHVERHHELQIKTRTLPSYGQELAHTADGTLKVALRQLVKPPPPPPPLPEPEPEEEED